MLKNTQQHHLLRGGKGWRTGPNSSAPHSQDSHPPSPHHAKAAAQARHPNRRSRTKGTAVSSSEKPGGLQTVRTLRNASLARFLFSSHTALPKPPSPASAHVGSGFRSMPQARGLVLKRKAWQGLSCFQVSPAENQTSYLLKGRTFLPTKTAPQTAESNDREKPSEGGYGWWGHGRP